MKLINIFVFSVLTINFIFINTYIAHAEDEYVCKVTGSIMKWPGWAKFVDPTSFPPEIIGTPAGGGSIIGKTFHVSFDTGAIRGLIPFTNSENNTEIIVTNKMTALNLTTFQIISINKPGKYANTLDIQIVKDRNITFSYFWSANGMLLIGECL